MKRGLDIIPVFERVCDLCNRRVADDQLLVTKSFVLTDWGTICLACWDERIEHPEQFRVARAYIKSERLEADWAVRPLVFVSLRTSERVAGLR